MKHWLFRHRLKLIVLGLSLGSLVAAHYTLRQIAHLVAPQVRLPPGKVTVGPGGERSFGSSEVRHRGRILQVSLKGTPASIGYAHARLLYPQMVENERVLQQYLARMVPSTLTRSALLDLALFRYMNVDQGMSSARLQEIAAEARGFRPDPFSGFLDTFQRFVYLNALYDISLSFEHSPLIGCTSFVLNGHGSSQGEPLLARAFDFEVDPIFDRDKAVFLVQEDGQIPFASVAWPGLVGVVSGMNAAGLAVVVHGARAGSPSNRGEPVVHALRRVLSVATSTEQAISALRERPAMVSHIVVVMDASGSAVAVERAPGLPQHVRHLAKQAAVTNHFEGPLANDPRNLRVREETSTLARRARADELLESLGDGATIQSAVALLRDRRGRHGHALPLGDRNAIDALIATHGVVMNTKKRQLWVSEGPHLLGRFLLFDLTQLMDHPEHAAESPEFIPSDPALHSPDVQRALSSDH